MKYNDKKWMTLNAHGKFCLKRFLFVISASELQTSQVDYLHDKGLIDYILNFPDRGKGRYPCAMKCLTDLGLETAKHYFPNEIK